MVNVKLKKILILFSLAMNLGLFIFALYLYSTDRTRSGGEHREQQMSLYKKLDLSSDQAAIISDLVREYAVERKRLRQQNKNLEKLLIQTLMDKNPNRNHLNQLLDQIGSYRRKREELTAEHLLKVKQVLNDKQAVKMFSELLEHAEKESR